MAPGFLLIAIVFSFILFLYFVPLGLWFQSGVSIGFGNIGMVKLIIMRFRKISPRLVVNGIINLHRAGLDFVTSEELETHFLAGGNITNVVDALIAADKANIEFFQPKNGGALVEISWQNSDLIS